MTQAQWISMAILVLWPVLWHIASPIGQVLASKLPAKQRDVLMEFAGIAVRQVEQVSMNMSNAAKKQLAVSLVIRLFRVFHIPLPPEDILDAAIEASVNMLPSKMIPPPVPIGE